MPAQRAQFEKEETTYQTALDNLERAYHLEENEAIKTKINALVAHIQMIYQKNGASKELVVALNSTTTLLNAYKTGARTFSAALNNYEKVAQTMEGHPSSALKLVGLMMLALAITILVLGIMATPMVTAILAATVAASVASANTMAVTGVAVAVTLPTLSSLGFFGQSGRSGLSQAMSKVGEKINEVEMTPALATA